MRYFCKLTKWRITGFHWINLDTYADYVEYDIDIDIDIDENSWNAYLFKRLDSETDKPVSEKLGMYLSFQHLVKLISNT